jgi:hypothetical protein
VELKFDVGVRFFGKGFVGMEAFYEKNVQPKAGWVDAWGRRQMQGSSQLGIMLLLGVVKEVAPLM